MIKIRRRARVLLVLAALGVAGTTTALAASHGHSDPAACRCMTAKD